MGLLSDKFTATFDEMIDILSAGNNTAKEILSKIKEDNFAAFTRFLTLDRYNITGDKISKLYTDCCNSDIKVFTRTLDVLKSDIYSQKQVKVNLEQKRVYLL